VETHSVGSTPTVGKSEIASSTQSETKEALMKVNLKQKWVVGLLVLTMLGLCGVFPTRSNTSSFVR